MTFDQKLSWCLQNIDGFQIETTVFVHNYPEDRVKVHTAIRAKFCRKSNNSHLCCYRNKFYLPKDWISEDEIKELAIDECIKQYKEFMGTCSSGEDRSLKSF